VRKADRRGHFARFQTSACRRWMSEKTHERSRTEKKRGERLKKNEGKEGKQRARAQQFQLEFFSGSAGRGACLVEGKGKRTHKEDGSKRSLSFTSSLAKFAGKQLIIRKILMKNREGGSTMTYRKNGPS